LAIQVDDFDIHEKHIEVHNTFRMSQEYEILPDLVKQQFDAHVAEHERYLQEQQMNAMMQALQQSAPQEGPGATMAGNGQVPDMTQQAGA